MLNGKDTIISLIAGKIEKDIIYMTEYFPKPKSLGENLKDKFGLSNYETKADLKNAAGVDTLDFAKKTDLADLKSDVDKLYTDKLKNVPSTFSNLKSKVDKLDVDKLVPVPINVSKLSDVVKNDAVYEYNGQIKNIEDKISNIINLVTILIPFLMLKCMRLKTKQKAEGLWNLNVIENVIFFDF